MEYIFIVAEISLVEDITTNKLEILLYCVFLRVNGQSYKS